MVKVTKYKLRKTAKNKGILGYQNMSERVITKYL